MKQLPRYTRTLRWMSADAVLIVGAFTFSYSLRSIVSPIAYGEYFPFILASTIIMVASLYFHGVYRRLWHRSSGHNSTIIVRAVVIATVILWVLDLLITPRPMPVSILLAGCLLSLGLLVGIRYRSRLLTGALWRFTAVLNRFRKGVKTPDQTRVLIIGAGESGQLTAMRFRYHKQIKVVGFIDDDPEKWQMYVENCPVLGSRDEIPGIAEKHDVDLIVMAIHNIDGVEFRDILGYCEQTKARIKLIPDTVALVTSDKEHPPLRDVTPEDLIGRSIITRHESVDLTPVMGRTVLVTGGAGSIGSELCRQMATYEPTRLVIVDNNESALYDVQIELKSKFPDIEVHPVLMDVSSGDKIRQLFREVKPQVVFHTAAYKHVPMLERYPQEAVRVNIGGTLNVASAALDNNAERFVLISTDKAVKPSNVMGASKRLCELLVCGIAESASDKQTLFTSVRFGNVLGSRGSVVPTFTRQIDAGGPVTVTHKDMKRYFMSIAEAVNLVIHAACLTQGNDLFILRMGEEVQILKIAEQMIRMRGLVPYKDLQIVFTGIRPGEKLNEELHTDDETVNETIHPHIMKLGGNAFTDHPDRVLEGARKLVSEGCKPNQSPLKQILEIIEQSRSDSDYHASAD